MTLGSAMAGRAPSTRPSSIGLSLQAQPAPWLYSVSRSGETSFISLLSMVIAHMALVFAAIAPHGGLSIDQACSPPERGVAAATRAGRMELAQPFTPPRPPAPVR